MAEDDAKTSLPAIAEAPPPAGQQIQAMVPNTPEEIAWTIGVIVRGGLVPDSYKDRSTGQPNKSQLAIGIMKGLELGVPPLTALANIAVINGRPTMWGDLMIAMVLKTGLLVGIKEDEIGTPAPDAGDVDKFDDSYGLEVALTRKGVEGPFIGRFTVGDARRAGLWMNNKRKPWLHHPKRMLRMRAIGFALRNGFADCLAGMYFREEIEDMPTEPKVVDRGFLDSSPIPPPESAVIENQPAAEASVSDHSEPESSVVGAPSTPDATAGWPFYREDGTLVSEYETAQWIDSLKTAVEIEAGRDGMTFPTPAFKANQETLKTMAETKEQRDELLRIQDIAFGKVKP